MVYMVDQSILTPEIGSSNPVIVSFIYTQQYQIRCADKVKMKKKGPGMAKILSCWRGRLSCAQMYKSYIKSPENTLCCNNSFFNGPFPATFSLFLSFQYTIDSKQMFNI